MDTEGVSVPKNPVKSRSNVPSSGNETTKQIQLLEFVDTGAALVSGKQATGDKSNRPTAIFMYGMKISTLSLALSQLSVLLHPNSDKTLSSSAFKQLLW